MTIQDRSPFAFPHHKQEVREMLVPWFWEANGLGSFFFLPILYITYIFNIGFVFFSKSIFKMNQF